MPGSAPQRMDAESAQHYARSDVGDGFSPEYTATSASADAAPAERKIIRNASLEIQAKNALDLYRSIVDFSTTLGGYEHSYSIRNYESWSVINAEIKIPPEHLGVFVQFIGDNGDIINSSMSSEDITESYFDVQTRLGTTRRSLDRYYELLSSARGVDEIVTIQRIIDVITVEIESLEGRLNLWNSLVNMSTVNLYIRQDNDPLQIRRDINWNTLSMDDMSYLIRRGFVTVTNTIVSVLQWLLVALVAYSPLWILLAAAVYLWWRLKKRADAKRRLLYGSGPGKPRDNADIVIPPVQADTTNEDIENPQP